MNMKTRKVLTILLFLLIIAFIGILLIETLRQHYVWTFCSKLGRNINTLIEEANYCDVDEDCITVSFGCTFSGCGSYVNRDANISFIREKVNLYEDGSCPVVFCNCLGVPEPACIGHKCKEMESNDTNL